MKQVYMEGRREMEEIRLHSMPPSDIDILVYNGSFGRLSTPTVHLIIQSNVLPIAGFVSHTSVNVCLTKPMMGETLL